MRRNLLVTVLLFLAAGRLAAEKFKNPPLYPTGSNPSAIAAADFNGDGKPDMVYEDSGAALTVHVVLGNGDASFHQVQELPLPFGFMPGRLTVADVNRDGKLDLILGGYSATPQVATLLGKGDGTFAAPIISVFAGMGSLYAKLSSGLAVADTNGDGAMDLIACDALNNYIFILLGNDTGSFALATAIRSNDSPISPFVGDFNGDGRPDFVVQGGWGRLLTVYLGNGDATFRSSGTYGTMVFSNILADTDSDGHPDLVTTDSSNTIQVYRGEPDGTFASTPTGGSYAGEWPELIGAVDLDHDGLLDLITTGNEGISVLAGSGNGGYAAPAHFLPGGIDSTVVAMADFNQDGHLDFGVAVPDGIALLLGNSDGTLQTFDSYDLPELVYATAAGDFDGDGTPDIAVNTKSGELHLLIGTGNGRFTVAPQTFATMMPVADFAIKADFNGDAKPDLLFYQNRISDAMVLLGEGAAGFSAPISAGAGFVADVNGDGRSDVVSRDMGYPRVLNTYLGQSDGTFTLLANTLPDLEAEWANISLAGDFNHDGKLDLALMGFALQILQGGGDGTFTMGRTYATQVFPYTNPIAAFTALAADIDGDGNLDVVGTMSMTGTAIGMLEIFYGKPDGSLSDPATIPLSRICPYLALADLNADGKLDFVLSDGKILAVIHNLGNRAFSPERHYVAASNIVGFTIQDLNHDGLPDIIVPSQGTSVVSVLLSQPEEKLVSGELHVAPEPSQYSRSMVMSVALAGANPADGIPTGTLMFSIDGQAVASVPLTQGAATYTQTATIDVGTHLVQARYSGDANFAPAIFTLQHTAVPLVIATTTELTASPNPSTASSTIRFTATVTTAQGEIPTGAVAFHDGNRTLGSVTLDDGGIAAFDTALLGPGSHPITALYLGNERPYWGNTGFAASTSAALPVVVTARVTTTTLTALPAAPQIGANVTLTAAVISPAGTPTGAVVFYEGQMALDSRPLDARGVAAYTATFATVGRHTINATYQANGPFASSTSARDIVVSNSDHANSTSTRLGSASDLANGSRVTTLTAAVTTIRGFPGGTVVFRDGQEEIGSAAVGEGGSATYSAALTPGLHYLTANYSGSTKYAASVSPVLIESVPSDAADFTLQLSASASSVPWGQAATVELAVVPVGGFRGDVSLSCSGAAPGLTCYFEPATIASGRGTSRLMITTPQLKIAQTSFPRGWKYGLAGLSTCCLLMFMVPRRNRRRTILWIGILVFLAAGLGCGLPQPSTYRASADYTITVTARALTGGSQPAHSAQFRLAVH